jgi:glycosyltransferase involved in cell wall biosynthesis
MIANGTVEILPMHAADAAALAGIDVLVLHSLPFQDAWDWLVDTGALNRVPTVQFVHSLLLAGFEQAMWGNLWSTWRGWPPACLVAPSHCTAARSRSLDEFARQRGGRLPPVEVIPHGVDRAAIEAGDRRKGRDSLGVDADTLVVLSLNRISPEKAEYRQLLLAFATATRSVRVRTRVVLVIAGAVSGRDKEYFRSLAPLAERLGIGEDVAFVTDVDERDKPSLLAAADLYVSLANNPQESFGIALLEALAAGLPVVATDWNGFGETLPAFYRGHTVPTIASHRLAQVVDWTAASEACAPLLEQATARLRRYLLDRQLREEHGERGRQHVQGLSWSASAVRLGHLLHDLVARFERGDRTPPPEADRRGEAWRPRSMVDGHASGYLEDDVRIRKSGLDGDAMLQSEATRLICFGQPVAYWTPDGGETRQRPPSLLVQRRGRRAMRTILAACQAAGEGGVGLHELRRRAGLEVAAFDWLVLQLIRYGLVGVATG